ncbi:hypothetical protein Btru_064392 [Bulinus truncatus]|nr:hypothetical protein Btru_064392 [Bulinus truncatus]
MTQQSLNADGQRNSESADFEEGRHLKVAVSSKGVCVSQLWESRKKKERFEKALNKVINGRLMPVLSKNALLKHQEKLRAYRQLITPFTPFNLPFEEDNRQRTLRGSPFIMTAECRPRGKSIETLRQSFKKYRADIVIRISDTEQIFMTSRISRLSMDPVRIIQPQVVDRQDTPVSDTRKVSLVVDTHADTRKTSLSVDAPARKLSVWVDEEALSEHQRELISAKKARGTDSSQPHTLTRGRFDPFKHSPWSFHERKCFFTSNFIPPHRRNELPVLLERPAEKDTPLARLASEESVSGLIDK